MQECTRCKGRGRVVHIIVNGVVKASPAYHSTPKEIVYQCAPCKGTGYVILSLIDPTTGQPLAPERERLVKKAYQLFQELTPQERGLILSWFCRDCNQYIPPGQSCQCANIHGSKPV